MTTDAILVDLDGTLADTKVLLFDAYLALLDIYGRQGTAAEFAELDGLLLADGMENLKETHGIKDSVDVMLAIHAGFFASNHKYAAPMKGAQILLSTAYSINIPCCVVTSAPRNIAISWLRQNNLAKYITSVISSDDVTHGKPHPEPYVTAALSLSSAPEDCLALEDSDLGLSSAIAAGCCAYLVGNQSSRYDAGVVSNLNEAVKLFVT